MRLIFLFSLMFSFSALAAGGANQQTLQAIKWELWEEGVSSVRLAEHNEKQSKQTLTEEVSYILDKFGL